MRSYFVVGGGAGVGKTTLLARLPGFAGPELSADRYPFEAVAAASSARVALLLVDATRGPEPAGVRDARLIAHFGLEPVLLVNKMDQVGYSEAAFRAITAAFALPDAVAIPVAAVDGDNVGERSARMRWYLGPTVKEHLEGEAARAEKVLPLRLPVRSYQPAPDHTIVEGTIACGMLQRGDRVRALPSGREAVVSRITGNGEDLDAAGAGHSVTVVLEGSIEPEPGSMLVAPQAPASVADQVQATLLWMHEEPMLPGRSYLIEIGGRTLPGRVTGVRHKLDLETMAQLAARRLDQGEVGSCNLSLAEPVVFDAFRENRATGGLLLHDEIRRECVGAGFVHFALRRAHNIHRQAVDVDQRARAEMKQQRPCVLWFTGLSASGKSTIANLVEKRLCALGRHTYLLDGDNVRHGLNKDLGFTDADRVENIRRVAEVAKLMVDAGLIVLVSFISPFRAERRMARELLQNGEFFEVFVDTSLDEAERRDPKGLYRKARRGELRHFTGIDSPYEPPENPEIHLDTSRLSAEAAAEVVLQRLEQPVPLA